MSVSNSNFLSPVGFQFTIKRLPNTAFFVQSCVLPGVTMSQIDRFTSLKTLNLPGNKLEREPFSVTLRLDEDVKSYVEIYDWMKSLTRDDDHQHYSDLQKSEYGLVSDASVFIMNSRKNPNIEFKFEDIFPIALGSIQMDTTNPDVNFVTCEVSFAHNGMLIQPVIR